MKNIKFVAICAASGFILSLICGFFSKSGFGHIFLIALIFAVIFGALSFGISVIFDKFLSVDTVAVDSGSSDSAEGPDGISAAGAKPVLGQHVDLVIQEEELEHSGNQNHYDVGENHQMLNEGDYATNGEQTEEQVVVPKNEFVPVRNKETVTNFSGSEAVTPAESDNRMEAIAEQKEKTGGDLDVLPDMSELNVGGSGGSSEDGETIVLSDADSDEREFVSSATNYKSSDVKETEIGDASLMAKAISSILSEET